MPSSVMPNSPALYVMSDTDLIEQQVSKVAEENGYHSQHIKNVTFKKISKSSSWRIESVEDLDKHLKFHSEDGFLVLLLDLHNLLV